MMVHDGPRGPHGGNVRYLKIGEVDAGTEHVQVLWCVAALSWRYVGAGGDHHAPWVAPGNCNGDSITCKITAGGGDGDVDLQSARCQSQEEQDQSEYTAAIHGI